MSDTMYLLARVASGVSMGLYGGIILSTHKTRNNFIRDLLGMDFLDNEAKKKMADICYDSDDVYMKIYGVGFLCALFTCISIWR